MSSPTSFQDRLREVESLSASPASRTIALAEAPLAVLGPGPTRADTLRRVAHAITPSTVPDRRFEVDRRREMRRFLSALLVIQMAYSLFGATTGGAGALSADRQVALWLGAGFFVVAAGTFVLVRRARSIVVIEAASFTAATVSIGACLVGQLQNPLTTHAVTVYEAVAMSVLAFALPWRPVTHLVWVAVAAGAAVAGVLATAPPSAERETLLAALGFSVAMAALGKLTVWNRRVERHIQRTDIRRLNDQLRTLSRTDPGTGLGTRLSMTEQLSRIASRRAGRTGFALIDVDNFKGVNDAYGHLVGDDVLRAVAGQIRGATRSGDGTFRYGGEEFLVIFDQVEQGGAATGGERIRAGVESTGLSSPTSRGGILSVSVGTVELDLPADEARLMGAIATADNNLYEAKRAGRNRVCSTLLGPQVLRGTTTG